MQLLRNKVQQIYFVYLYRIMLMFLKNDEWGYYANHTAIYD